MAFKDEWIDKKDDEDDVMANDINIIAHEVIALDKNKENASNKTKVINSNSTDEEYPSAKAVFNHTADVSSNIMQEVYNHHESAMQSIGEEATYRATAVQQLENDKADKSTTLDGYGITDAYTKSEVDTMLGDFETLITELHTYAQNKVNGGVTS